MSFIKEFFEFLRKRKKYWLLPIIIVLVKLAQKIAQKYKKSFYNISFNEGASLNSIEIYAKETHSTTIRLAPALTIDEKQME